MRDRAYRRQQDERARHRALRALERLFVSDLLRPIPARMVHRYAIDRTPCSCPLCGNPRRYFGTRSIQERRHDAPRDDGL